MQTIFYATAGDTSSSEHSFNPSLCAENRLNLLPEHIAQISNAFIIQLSLARLSPRDSRVLCAIYSQTIGYDKREDDMNGTRLEQLTAIRYDHANDSVLRLEALNIILTREGHYGKWMSINFDFKHWGKECFESANNDPSCLLSDVYQSTASQQTVEFQLHVLPESRKKEPKVVIKTEEISVTPPPVLPSESIPDPVKPSVSATKIETETAVKTAVETATKKPEQAPFELNFPDSFPEKLRQQVIQQLASFKIPQHAQRLLDYFAKCLKNGNIRNPMGYFIDLKKRWLRGSLELDDDQPQASPLINEKKVEQQQTIEQRIAYQHAFADLEQLKKVIKSVGKEHHCSFEEALKKIDFTAIWEKAIECLEQARKACSMANITC